MIQALSPGQQAAQGTRLTTYSISHRLPVGHNLALHPPLPPLRFAHGPHQLRAQQRWGSLGKALYRHCQMRGKKA